MDNRPELRESFASRRATVIPAQAGLPAHGGTRRAPGLCREEVAMLAGAGLALVLSLTACSETASPSSAPTADPATPTAAPTAPSAAPENENATTPPSSAPSAGNEYTDGEYSATGWYGSLPSHQDVTLTLQDGTITDVEITTPAENETSLGYQTRFAEALPDAAIGRPIAELAIDRVAGSSGCSEGFMDALAQIKEEAAV